MTTSEDEILAEAWKRIDRDRSVTRRLEDIERKVDVIGDLVSLLLGITLAGLAFGLLAGHFGWIVGAVAAAVVFIAVRSLAILFSRR